MIVVVLGAVGVWWRRQRRPPTVAPKPDIPEDSKTVLTDNTRGTAAVFVSDDALQWHRAPVEFSEGTGIETLIAYDDLLIAVGSRRRRGSAARKSDLALWVSSDAVTWEPVDPGRVGISSRAVAAIGLEGGVVISGVRSVDSDLAETPVIWRFDPRERLAPAP